VQPATTQIIKKHKQGKVQEQVNKV